MILQLIVVSPPHQTKVHVELALCTLSRFGSDSTHILLLRQLSISQRFPILPRSFYRVSYRTTKPLHSPFIATRLLHFLSFQHQHLTRLISLIHCSTLLSEALLLTIWLRGLSLMDEAITKQKPTIRHTIISSALKKDGRS